MLLEIFDVQHGACALLTADNETRLMIDCGQNTDAEWRPGTHLLENGIDTLEMLAVTNYDEDHARGAPDLFDKIDVKWLVRNKSVSAATIKQLKSDDGMGEGIDRLVWEIENTYTGSKSGTRSPKPVFEGLERKTFSNSYPEFEDENNLSMALFLKCNGIGA